MLPDTYTALDAAAVAAMDRGDKPELARLEAVLNTPPASAPDVSLLGAALWYAGQGYPVFRCVPGEKRPLPGSRGLREATTDESTIRAWWQATPHANIGLRTGVTHDVIDIDGTPGHASITDKLRDTPDLPSLLGVSLTPRDGGMHLWIAATGRGNKAGWGQSVDYRGDGGYVVAAPSRTEHGTYRWLLPLTHGG